MGTKTAGPTTATKTTATKTTATKTTATKTTATKTTATVRLGAWSNAELAALSNDDALAELREATRLRAALDGHVAQLGAEVGRRQAFRGVGATSLEALLIGHHGLGAAAARTLARVGERLFDLPHLQQALSTGELSLDQVRVLVEVADPETDPEWVEAARDLPVRDLAALAERHRDLPPRGGGNKGGGPAQGSVRSNDQACTMTARLRRNDYAAVRRAVEARVAAMGSDGTTPLDVRSADALVSMLAGSGSGAADASAQAAPPTLVAHVALKELVALPGRPASSLVAELERAGLISAEVLERLACDAIFIVGLDDEAGRTMYEGRAHRFPSETQRRELWRRDRHCRFPGCTNAWFTHVHHLVPWSMEGRTDTDNLATLCAYHHHELHSKRWSVSGDANVELSFVGPGGRVMTSRPSPLWHTIGGVPTAGPGTGTAKTADEVNANGRARARARPGSAQP